ncbi:TIGR03618 family F420-dependent PPOX class oxidoreductase [Streptomyces sp. SID3343]|nr:PPOX class F420-dependent oxidoreductase [Streptomyces sp. SID3343]MYW05006.1 TIGR03618 family F420-dependent PPOX class oxidoreductase [Streptomyces sp. SID3343]
MDTDMDTKLLGTDRRGVLTTLKRDGRPQLSPVSYLWEPDLRRIRISATDDRAKTRNLRRDPRASFLVTAPEYAAYLIAEGLAEVSAPALARDDAITEELVEVFRLIAGEHPDWAEYRDVMVEERRVVIRIAVERTYGWSRD